MPQRSQLSFNQTNMAVHYKAIFTQQILYMVDYKQFNILNVWQSKEI